VVGLGSKIGTESEKNSRKWPIAFKKQMVKDAGDNRWSFVALQQKGLK